MSRKRKALVQGKGLCLIVLFGSLLFWSHNSQASNPALCKKSFKQKRYKLAATCFSELADAIEKKGKLNEENRLEVGSYLRNAAISYSRAAKQEKSAQRAAHLYEKGAQSIQKYIDKKYYENASQRRKAIAFKEKLERKVGYTQITITTGHTKAKLQVTSNLMKKTTMGATFSSRLAPNTYTVIVTYPSGMSKTKLLTIKPNSQPQLLKFDPPATRIPPRRVVLPKAKPSGSIIHWVVIGVGGVLAITGGVLAGMGSSANGEAIEDAKELKTKMNNPNEKVSAEDTKKIVEEHEEAKLMYTSGFAVLGVGVAVAVVGIIMMAAKPKTPPKKSSQLPKTSLIRTKALFKQKFQ